MPIPQIQFKRRAYNTDTQLSAPLGRGGEAPSGMGQTLDEKIIDVICYVICMPVGTRIYKCFLPVGISHYTYIYIYSHI